MRITFLLSQVFLLGIAIFPALAGNYFQGVSPATVPWPGGIVPYLFDTNYPVTAAESNAIVAGLREWQLAADVKFVPYTNQANHVLLQYSNDGSGTGYYLSGAPATLMVHGLARGLICHESGHLFGLQHEHQRIDRGNYITINYANIAAGSNGEGYAAFMIDSNSTSFGPYDLVSVMHYGPDSFTNGLGDALDPLPAYEKYYHKLGNIALSSGDRAAVSNLYGGPVMALTNVVTNTADGGFGSLRAAIYYANDHPGTAIRFNIPDTDPGYSNGTYTISLLGELPPLVSAGIVVDGTTQPGFSTHPIVVVDGTQVPVAAGPVSGLHLYGTNGVVRGLAFDNFSYAGVQLFCSDAASNAVQNCYLGLRPDGSNDAPNFLAGAIFQFGAHDNVIGGLASTQRNIISGNSEYGVILNDTNSDRNVIEGNYVGVNATGAFAVSNGYSGIGIWDGPNSTAISSNVLSGNYQYGIYISDANVSGTTVQGNFIGTDLSGSNSIPNGNAMTNSYAGVGIFGGTHGNLIGGTNAAARNIISGNTNAGIYLQDPGTTNNIIEGNYIGLDVSGTLALPPQQNGIFVLNGATGNTIGGTSAVARNIISGNAQYGIYISDPGTSGNFMLGNYIGTDATGTTGIGNGGFNVWLQNSASENFIGLPGAGNLISGNPGFSYGLGMQEVSGNVVQANLVGTDASGELPLGNGFAGVAIWGGSTGNVVGGTMAGARNVISGNGGYGVYIAEPGTSGNSVQGNFIGTDLTGSNAMPNDYANIDLLDDATGNFIGGAGAGQGNVIAFSYGAGVVIYDPGTTNNAIRGNTIFSNDYLGINFGNDGVVANHTGFEAGPNDLQDFPIITNAVINGSTASISGTLSSMANDTYFIDVYRNIAADYSGYGQGQFYVGSTTLTTDGSGNGTFRLAAASAAPGQYFSATATSSGGDTSEFGADVIATNGPAPAQFIGPFTLIGNGFNATISLTVGQNYNIEATTNLADSNSWKSVTNISAASSTYLFTDHSATNINARFYRVVSP